MDPERAGMTHFVVQSTLLGQTGLLMMGAVRWQVHSVCVLKRGWTKEKYHTHLSLTVLGFRSRQWMQDCSQAVGHS